MTSAQKGYFLGYYGASNEALMMEALVNDGPLAVNLKTYSDFHNYESGIYRHTGLTDGFNPFVVNTKTFSFHRFFFRIA